MMSKKEIQPSDIWNNEKRKTLKEMISGHSKKQSRERQLQNRLLSIRYRLEDYLQSDEGDELKVLDFVKMYLEALGISKKQLAHHFGLEDSNFHKYLSGDRKLNTELVMKLSAFSHTQPEQWFAIQSKNEIRKIRNDKRMLRKYGKYDYKNLVDVDG